MRAFKTHEKRTRGIPDSGFHNSFVDDNSAVHGVKVKVLTQEAKESNENKQETNCLAHNKM